jgi:uncharacterized protein (TIGR03435 family)
MLGSRHYLKIGIGLLLMAAFSAPAVLGHGQSSTGPSGFEVASIRPTSSTDGRAFVQATPGRLAMTNLALRRLILIAYNIQDDQLVGELGSADSVHYDIQAKVDGNPSVEQMEGPMMRSLLQERFRLMLHRETRQISVYKLSVTKGGPRLQPSKAGSCTPYATDSPPPTATTGEPGPNYCGLHAAVNGLNRTLDGKGVTMATLAKNLSRSYTAALGRDVIDGTGLAGIFDIHLEWTMDPPTTVSDDAGNLTAPDSRGESIFTALQEQLGLRLEPAKDAVEVLVIDHIERPTGN